MLEVIVRVWPLKVSVVHSQSFNYIPPRECKGTEGSPGSSPLLQQCLSLDPHSLPHALGGRDYSTPS